MVESPFGVLTVTTVSQSHRWLGLTSDIVKYPKLKLYPDHLSQSHRWLGLTSDAVRWPQEVFEIILSQSHRWLGLTSDCWRWLLLQLLATEKSQSHRWLGLTSDKKPKTTKLFDLTMSQSHRWLGLTSDSGYAHASHDPK